MIGCTTMERHIVATSLKTPLERLAGKSENPWTFIDVPANHTGEIDARCQFLYIDITHEETLSDEVYAAILYQLHKSAHVILYRLDFKLDPGFSNPPGYQELALYPLRIIELRTPTYASVEWIPDGTEDGKMIVNTYSLRSVVTSGA